MLTSPPEPRRIELAARGRLVCDASPRGRRGPSTQQAPLSGRTQPP